MVVCDGLPGASMDPQIPRDAVPGAYTPLPSVCVLEAVHSSTEPQRQGQTRRNPTVLQFSSIGLPVGPACRKTLCISTARAPGRYSFEN